LIGMGEGLFFGAGLALGLTDARSHSTSHPLLTTR
jgi:hypothetical protein